MSKPIKVLALLALMAVLAVIALSLLIRSHLSIDTLVANLEKSYNLRAQIGDHEAKILAHPGRSLASRSLLIDLVVNDLVIAPRDEVVDAGTPHSERDPIADELAVLGVEKVELEVDLRDLLGWELDIRKLILHGLRAAITIDKEGADSLAPLLEKPGQQAAGEPVENIEELETAEIQVKAAATKKIRPPIPATMSRAAITSGSLAIANQRQGSHTTLEDFQLELTDISIDADNLTERNRCSLKISTRLTMANLASGESFLDFIIRGEGEAEPLDRRDGSFSPSLDADITIAQGSSISGLPFLGMLSGSIDTLSKIGLNLGDLKSRSVLSENVTTSLLYRKGQLLFRDPLELDFDRYALGLGEGSWLNLETLQHEFKGRITVSEELTADARDGVEKFIRDKASDTIADVATDSLLTPLMNAAGRLSLSFLSSGPLPDPDVGIITPIGDIGRIMEDLGKKLIRGKGGIQGLLKGLLD